MSSRVVSRYRTPLSVGTVVGLFLRLLAHLHQHVTCNAFRSVLQFYPTHARMGKNRERVQNALHVTFLQSVAARGYMGGAAVVDRLFAIPKALARLGERLSLWLSRVRLKLIVNPRFPSFRNIPLTRMLAAFSLFNIIMGILLIWSPDKIEYLGFQSSMVPWSIVYGCGFIVAGLILLSSAFIWPSLSLEQQIWLQTGGFGAGVGITLGWLLLLVIGTVERTGDWTVVMPWTLVLYLKLVIFNRYLDIERPIPKEMRRLLRDGRT